MINIHTLAQCAAVIGGKLLQGTGAETITGVSIDTRTLKPGNVYLALKGDNLDGHAFVAQAVAAGASAVIVNKPVHVDCPVLQVKDTLTALTALGKYCRDQFTGAVVAITGSSGKTTVKECCRHIFSQAGQVLTPERSFNNHIGVPLTLCQLTPAHKYVVLEMGTNHPGEIAVLVEIAKPTISLINNIGVAHVGHFASEAAIAEEKGAIYRGLPADGIAVINQDDKYAKLFHQYSVHCNKLTFGQKAATDLQALHKKFDEQVCASFVLRTPSGEVKIKLPLPGEHQVMNALAAASCAYAAGLTLEQIQAGLSAMQAVPGRWQPQVGIGGFQLIDDSYNANPDSVIAALTCLSQFSGDRWFVLGDMGELGDLAHDCHAQVGQTAAKLGINQFFTVGELSRAASEAFGRSAKHFRDQHALITFLKNELTPNVTLVIKGSRAAKMENIVRALTEGAS